MRSSLPICSMVYLPPFGSGSALPGRLDATGRHACARTTTFRRRYKRTRRRSPHLRSGCGTDFSRALRPIRPAHAGPSSPLLEGAHSATRRFKPQGSRREDSVISATRDQAGRRHPSAGDRQGSFQPGGGCLYSPAQRLLGEAGTRKSSQQGNAVTVVFKGTLETATR